MFLILNLNFLDTFFENFTSLNIMKNSEVCTVSYREQNIIICEQTQSGLNLDHFWIDHNIILCNDL